MRASQFVEAYPSTLAPAEIHRGAHSHLIEPEQNWSYRFGRLLHATLSGEAPDVLSTEQELEPYKIWSGPQFIDRYNELTRNTSPEGLRALNEATFHVLNKRMLGLWAPLQHRDWSSESERVRRLNYAQDTLAMDGLTSYIGRQRMVDKAGGGHVLFEPDNIDPIATSTGILQEIDTAIVLADVVRRNRNLTIVPAPLQFERSDSRRRNVDFVVVDFLGQRAVGVQVKTNVRQHAFDEADPDRVVFIDGTVDLGNVKAMRTIKNRSKESVIPWPGIIAAKRVHDIQTYGKRAAHVRDKRYAMQQKMIARQLVGNIRVDYSQLSSTIGERILEKL